MLYGRKALIERINIKGVEKWNWIIWVHRTNERSIPFYSVQNEIDYESREEAKKDCDQVFKELGLLAKQNFTGTETVTEKTN